MIIDYIKYCVKLKEKYKISGDFCSPDILSSKIFNYFSLLSALAIPIPVRAHTRAKIIPE